MPNRRVRAGTVYTFDPVGLDIFDPKTPAVKGQKVRGLTEVRESHYVDGPAE
jgi:hypothetical protein